ncbi:MAG: gliding motility protein GldL [Bacteroidetes bacterium]|nr:gliding motility protein GldL [Bacteroidota bacterium]MCL1969472.1 gliding motility protein GldL [Bacteroidota bacterium]
MGLYKIVRSKGYKKFMARLYGWGAAVVILGALFKILHIKGADLMLMLGMGTEAIIFFFSAFEPLHKEFNWALVYPQLGLSEESDMSDQPKPTVTQQLDKMLEEAKIGPELIDSLASGMRNLSENARKLSYTTDAAAATEGYVSNLSKAKDAVQNLTGIYEKSADAIFTTSDMQVKGMQDLLDKQKQHVQKIQDTLTTTSDMQVKGMQEIIDKQKQHAQKLQDSLSTTTDLQVKGAQELFDVQKQHAQKLQNALTTTSEMQVKSVQEMFEMQKIHAQQLNETQMQNAQKLGQIQDQGSQAIFDNFKKIQESAAILANSMSDTVQETQKYKQEVDQLSKNVAQINAIYANMLAAMTTK